MPNLLLIEDNQHIQRIFSTKFHVEGFTVTAADTGEQGLALIDSCQPDAIVLDIMLPGMDGFEVLRRLAADAEHNTIPVLMLSNKAWPDDVNLALTLGARHFYTKGAAIPQKIVADIRKLCDLKQAMVVSANVDTAQPLVDQLQHPRLLCALNHVLAEAMSAVQRSLPDVVVLDATPMGGMFHVILQQLKSATLTQAIPVVAVTMEEPRIQRADAYVTRLQIDTVLRPTVLQMSGITDVGTFASSMLVVR